MEGYIILIDPALAWAIEAVQVAEDIGLATAARRLHFIALVTRPRVTGGPTAPGPGPASRARHRQKQKVNGAQREQQHEPQGLSEVVFAA
jgi:hypothetical protein